MEENISFSDFILSRLNSVYFNLITPSSTIRNWYVLIPFYLGVTKKCTLTSRSGKKITLNSWNAFIDYWNSPENISEIIGDKVKISIGRNEVKVHYLGRTLSLSFSDKAMLGRVLFEVYGHFVEQEYAKLEVKGRDVIDVGAGLGESAVYFSARRARHVYSLEPFPRAYKMAKLNIARNKLAKRVTLLNKGCGGENTSIRINPQYHSTPASTLHDAKAGRRVPVVTLEKLMKEYGIKSAVLKMDCEGAEYGAILNSSSKTLGKFSQIVMEYHYGYRNIARRLEKEGFKVKVTLPRYFVQKREKNRMYMGLLFAYR